jgi:orotate phosphoribosyltransferase
MRRVASPAAGQTRTGAWARMGRLAEQQQELCDVLTRQSVRLAPPGEFFTLASGKKSRYFFDCKATTLSPRGALLTGRILFDILRARNLDIVGGLAMGSTYMSTAVSVVSEEMGYPIYGFSVRDERKTHGMKQDVDVSFHPDGKPLLGPGRRVAVVDDVVTMGGSILKAIDFVRARECQIDLVLTLVDRMEGGGDILRGQGLPYVALFNADSTGKLSVNDLGSLSGAASLPTQAALRR